jgi:hypothetical protein
MKTIYVKPNTFECYITDDGTMIAVETDFFDGKCDIFIEGYRFVPTGCEWVREDGKVFNGEMITPWKDYNELDNAQREYEKQLLAEYEAELAELDALILDQQYNSLMEDL